MYSEKERGGREVRGLRTGLCLGREPTSCSPSLSVTLLVIDIAINPNKCDKIDYEHAGVISAAYTHTHRNTEAHAYTYTNTHTHSSFDRLHMSTRLLAGIIDYVLPV